MVVNNDHFINDVLYDPGDHRLTVERYDTDYVLVAARILADPNDAADLAAVNGLQDQLTLTAESARPFVMPDYDQASFEATRDALLALSRGMTSFARPSAARMPSTRSGICSARRPVGAGSPSRRRTTSTSIPGFRPASTRSRCATFRSTASGRSRSTTPTGTSSRTTATPTA